MAHKHYSAVEKKLREGLITIEEGALILHCSSEELEIHFNKHVRQVDARTLEKIIILVKSDALRNYDVLQGTFRAIEKNLDPAEIKMKIELSKEIRALKKDIDEFIVKHADRLARDHQNLETQWLRMQEFLLFDACKNCRTQLKKTLKEED